MIVMEPVFIPNKKRRKRNIERRVMGIFLSAALVFPVLPAGGMTVYASLEKTEGLCGRYPAHTVERISAAAIVVSGSLDFSSPGTDPGNLDTTGYYWDGTQKTLRLKNVNIGGAVILPDDTVTIETTGNCFVQELSAGSAPDKAKLNFTGTGRLTIENEILICGGDNNSFTVAEGSYVAASGGINIGASGGVNATVTVQGTLTVEGKLSAGGVIVDAGGLLDISGTQGVTLHGSTNSGSYTAADMFVVRPGGCFTANCQEYNVKAVAGGDSFPSGSNADHAFNIPDGYLPADCEVKLMGGEINLVKKSTGEVYTGALTIHENHSWPDGWNRRDESGHWKECIFEGCGRTKGYEAHSYDSNTGECVCGSKLAVTLNGADSLIYNGQEKKPGITVTVDGVVLDKSKYDTAYSNNINAGEALVTVTGKNGPNFKQTVKFQIVRATPTLSWGSAVQTVVYSGKQAAITPPAVTLADGGSFDGEISYSYAAEGAADYTSGLPVNAGTYIVRARIEEQDNYTAADSADTLKLTVEKAENPPNMPSGAMEVAAKCEKISDVELPAGWQWQETDKDTALQIKIPLTATAVYVGADKDNYKNVTATVVITRADYDRENADGKDVIDTADRQKGQGGDMSAESPGTGDGDESRQSERLWRLWWFMAAAALTVMAGSGFLTAKRKKRESDR